MFLETGERTASVDVMQKAWTGDWPTHQAPQIQSLRLNAEEAPKSIEGAVNQVFHAEVHATESDDHLISWRVREEVPTALQSDGGDFEPPRQRLKRSSERRIDNLIFNYPSRASTGSSVR